MLLTTEDGVNNLTVFLSLYRPEGVAEYIYVDSFSFDLCTVDKSSFVVKFQGLVSRVCS